MPSAAAKAEPNPHDSNSIPLRSQLKSSQLVPAVLRHMPAYLQILPACRCWQTTDGDTEACARAPVAGAPWWATWVATPCLLHPQGGAVEIITIPGMCCILSTPAHNEQRKSVTTGAAAATAACTVSRSSPCQPIQHIQRGDKGSHLSSANSIKAKGGGLGGILMSMALMVPNCTAHTQRVSQPGSAVPSRWEDGATLLHVPVIQ